jgi:hypothetical protein
MSTLSLTFRAVGPAREHSLASPADAAPVVEVAWDGCTLPALLAVVRSTTVGANATSRDLRRPLPGWTTDARATISVHAAGGSNAGRQSWPGVLGRMNIAACPSCGRLTTGKLAAHRESLWCEAWSEETACLREGLEVVRSQELADVLAATGALVVRRTALTNDGAQRNEPTDTAVIDWAPAGLVWALRWVRDRGLGRGYAEALEALSAQTELSREAQRLACELGPAVRAWTHKRDQDAARALLLDALGPIMQRAGVDAAPTQGQLL